MFTETQPIIQKIKSRATLFGVGFWLICWVLALVLSGENYSIMRHGPSELMAQGAVWTIFMRTGFIALGLAAFYDGRKQYWQSPLATVAFGTFGVATIFMALVSIRPVDPVMVFNAAEDNLHFLGGLLASITFIIGALALARCQQDPIRKKTAFLGVLALIGFKIAALYWSEIYGLLSHLTYLIMLVWLVVFLPVLQDPVHKPEPYFK